LTVPATRHKSSGAVVVPETVSPAVYDCANVIVVFGKERLIRLWQVVAFAARQVSIRQGARSNDKTHRLQIDRVLPNGSCHENLVGCGSMPGKGGDFMDITPLGL
jgi:hypothetical protein